MNLRKIILALTIGIFTCMEEINRRQQERQQLEKQLQEQQKQYQGKEQQLERRIQEEEIQLQQKRKKLKLKQESYIKRYEVVGLAIRADDTESVRQREEEEEEEEMERRRSSIDKKKEILHKWQQTQDKIISLYKEYKKLEEKNDVSEENLQYLRQQQQIKEKEINNLLKKYIENQ